MVTGTTNNSRLPELRKYKISGSFLTLYTQSTSSSIDGVNPILSQVTTYPYMVIYYIGGITYTDIIQFDGSSITRFSYLPQGTGNTLNFFNAPYIKNPNKEKIISNPKIIDDVFIVRSNQSAFDKNYRLEYIGNLVDLTTYAGGKFFNIINNS